MMSDYGMENVTLTSMNRNPAEDVRYRRNSGKHSLVLSFSHFDPNRTLPSLRRINRRRADQACFRPAASIY